MPPGSSVETSFGERLNVAISNQGLDGRFREAYADISGDDDVRTYWETRSAFAKSLLNTPLRHLTESSADPAVLFDAWRHFLLFGGSPRGTAGRARAEAVRKVPTFPFLRFSSRADGGIEVKAMQDTFIVNTSPLSFQQSSLVVNTNVTMPGASVPVSLPSNQTVFETSALALVRFDESHLGVLLRAPKGQNSSPYLNLGSVSLLYGQTDEAAYAAAWNKYTDDLLEKAWTLTQSIEKMGLVKGAGNARRRTWDQLPPEEKSRFVFQFTAFQQALAKGSAFFEASEPPPPLQGTPSYDFAQAEYTQILSRVKPSVGSLGKSIADEKTREKDFLDLREGIAALFAPNKYLDLVYQQAILLRSEMKERAIDPDSRFNLQILSNNYVGNIVGNPVALRKILIGITLPYKQKGQRETVPGWPSGPPMNVRLPRRGQGLITITDALGRLPAIDALRESLAVPLQQLGATLSFNAKDGKARPYNEIVLSFPLLPDEDAAPQRGAPRRGFQGVPAEAKGTQADAEALTRLEEQIRKAIGEEKWGKLGPEQQRGLALYIIGEATGHEVGASTISPQRIRGLYKGFTSSSVKVGVGVPVAP